MKIFSFDPSEYNRINSPKSRKQLTSLLISVFIELGSIIGFIFTISNLQPSTVSLIIRGVLLLLAIIFFFVSFYKILIYFSKYSEIGIVSMRCYVINNNKLYSIMFFNELDENILNEFFLTKGMPKEEETDSLNIIQCLEFTKVYSIQEFDDRFEIICDYLDVLNNNIKNKDKIVIYKYFQNLNDVIQKLNEIKN